jgi:hypothetical protein
MRTGRSPDALFSFPSKKGLRMRASSALCAAVVITGLVLTGCRGGSGWSWNRKNGGSGANLAQSEPKLPSSGATPAALAAGATQAPTSPYAQQAAATPHMPASYPGQPTGYSNPAGGALLLNLV